MIPARWFRTCAANVAATYWDRRDPLFSISLTALGIFGLLAGVYLFIKGFFLLNRKRLILSTPTSTVRGAAIGRVEVCGKMVGPYTLLSPLSQTDCLYYKAEAWQEVSGDKKRWNKVAVEEMCVPLFLQDETGQVSVDPRGAELELKVSCEEECDSLSASLPLRRFLDRHGVDFFAKVKLQERCICQGESLYVMATLDENRGTMMAGNSWDTRLRLPVLSRAAADLQRREVLESIQVEAPRWSPEVPPSQAFETDYPVILAKGSRRNPFFISHFSEREVVAELAKKSALYIWGGPALALVSLALLLSWLGLWS